MREAEGFLWRLSAALLDQFATTVRPGRSAVLDIDDTFSAAHGRQQLAFWNAHHDERGFASMHIYHVASSTPVAAIPAMGITPVARSAQRPGTLTAPGFAGGATRATRGFTAG